MAPTTSNKDKHRQKSLSIFYRDNLCQRHLQILLCTQGFASRHISAVGIPAQDVFFKIVCSSLPMNRYQYYLQVKKDVLEGRLRCTLEQVIRLAGLAVQGKTLS
jgi:hypothetical protein